MRTWEDNADEFGALDEGEGWPFARLVACSVKLRQRGGQDESSRDDSKTSASEFARRAKTGDHRVARYLEGWDAAAKLGLVASSENLTPDDTNTPYPVEPEHSWMKPGAGNSVTLRFVNTTKKPTGGRPRDSRPADAAAIIDRQGPEAVVDAMDDEAKQKMLDALVRKTPTPAKDHAAKEREKEREEAKARDGKPKPDMETGLQHLIDSEEMTQRVARLVNQIRGGLMDKMDDEVKAEAVALFRKWVTSLEWAITFIEGGAVTDEALAKFMDR